MSLVDGQFIQNLDDLSSQSGDSTGLLLRGHNNLARTASIHIPQTSQR